jgi:hypothetical protein
MGSMFSAAQEERIVQAAGPGGQVLLLLDEDNAGRKGRREARDRLSRWVRTKILRLPEAGLEGAAGF